MPDDKIRAELCRDHFERLVHQDVCATCPSRLENEAVVVAMSKVIAADSEQAVDRAIVTELRSIRRTINENDKRCDERFEKIDERLNSVDKRLTGNGAQGIDHRLTVLETRQDESGKNKTATVAMIGMIVSTIIGLIALFK